MKRTAFFLSAVATANAQGLLPSCAPGFTKVVDAAGTCGLYQCTSAAGPAYCPCPFLYADVSADLNGSECACLLGTLCSEVCPEGYVYVAATSTCNPGSSTAGDVAGGSKTRFNITLQNKGAPKEYEALFQEAAERWEQVITADLSDFGADEAPQNGWFDGQFPDQEFFGAVDDIVIGFRVAKIDGVGGTLAQAGPLVSRKKTDAAGNPLPSGGLPVSGLMEFDIDDAAPGFADGSLKTVILHEMGHVLGLGTLWPTVGNGCASTCGAYAAGASGPCAAAVEYQALGLSGQLQIEQEGGQGTACGHWSEQQLLNELMTGKLNPTVSYNPLTTITIGAMQDLGYTVDFSVADSIEEPVSRRNERLLKEASVTAAGGTPYSAKANSLMLQNDILQRTVIEHTQKQHR